MPRADPSRRWLVAILTLAALLRFVPIWFGLPYADARPDEDVAIGHALEALGGSYNPHFFDWPSLTFYVFAACFGVASAIRRAAGLDPALTSAALHLVARGAIAACGTATVAIVYMLTRRMADRATALAAAAFLAVAPLHVRDSHFAMTDVLATFFAVSSLVLLLRATDDAESGAPATGRVLAWFAATGLVGGLAASTKYSAGAVAASMLAAQAMIVTQHRDRWRDWRLWLPCAVFAIACGVGFLVGTPYALLDRPSFVAGVRYDFTHLSGGHTGARFAIGWTYHLVQSLPAAVGWPMAAAGLVGIVAMARARPRPTIIVWSFGALLYASLGPGHTVFFRYILPLVPLVCIAAAFAVRWTRWWSVAVLVAAPALVTSVWSDVLLARADTRQLAAEWLAGHARPDESLYQAGTFYADVDLDGVRVHQWPKEMYDARTERFQNPGGDLPDWLIVPQSPLTLYTSVTPGLLRTAAERYEVAHRVRATRPDAPDSGVYDPDDAFFLPVTGFGAVIRPGPTVLIYRRLGLR